MQVGLVIVLIIVVVIAVFIIGVFKFSVKKSTNNMFDIVKMNIENISEIETNNKVNVTTKMTVNGEEVEDIPESISDIMEDVKNMVKSMGGNKDNSEENFYFSCEYCGTENEAKRTKCVGCGASLKRKGK